MALVACNECQKEISDQAAACPHCGAPVGQRNQNSAYQNFGNPQLVKTAKSRGLYVILGLFFGLLGVHNFYVGRFGVGVAQLLITCILGWFVVGLFITAIWVIVELFIIKTDGAGDPMS